MKSNLGQSIRLLSFLGVSAGSLMALSSPVYAQSADEEAANSGEIIVTARRRNEALQDTPVAITAVNAAMIADKAAVNIGDLMGTAPNLLITQQNSGASAANLSIRGMSYADVEKSQEPTVGVVVDGVFIGTNTGQLLDFFDIEQVEVLRGPQGTLFGRNTIGGVINIRRTKPTMDTGLKAEFTYGKFNTYSGKAVMNLGDGEHIGLKTFYMENQSDGFYRHGVTGKHVGKYNNKNFGASLLVNLDNFDGLLTVEKLEQHSTPVNATITRTGEAFCGLVPAIQCNRNTTNDLYTVFVDPAESTYSAPAVTLEMNLDLGGIKLTSISSYRKGTEKQSQDFDASTSDLFYTLRMQHYEQWSQEVRGAGKLGDNFDYVVGGYFFSSNYDMKQHTRLFKFNAALDPTVADTNPRVTFGKNRSVAAFGDFIWSFADKMRLSFGGRYTWDEKTLDLTFLKTGRLGLGNGKFSKFTPKVGLDYRPNEDVMLYGSWSNGYRSGGFSPRAATAETAGVPYQPEVVDTFEAGAKLDLLDRKLQFNMSGFYSDYKDLQQSTTIPGGPNGNQTIVSNVGKAIIKGVEVDFAARPTDKLRITGAMGLTDSKFKNFIAGNTIGNVRSVFVGTIPAGAQAILTAGGANAATYNGTPTAVDYSANRMIYAPKFTASIGAEYKIPVGENDLMLNVGYRYLSPYDQQISLGPITGTLPDAAVVSGKVVVTQPSSPVVVNGNDPRVRTDAQGLLDASATMRFDLGGLKAKATIWGRNLLDDRGTSAAFTVAGLFSFASAREPQTFGATVGIEF